MPTMPCPTCLEPTGHRITRRCETYPVRGESIEVDVDVVTCVECDAEIADPDLEDAALGRAYDLYRCKYGIIRPEEIRTLRERYGLSQRAFARLLDWGAVTIHRYETGALPDSVHSDLLEMLQDQSTMADFLMRHSTRLHPQEAKRALAAAATGRSTSAHQRVASIIQEKVDAYPEDARGNRWLDLERLCQMMVYFAHPTGVVLTKLLKLLWYADFLAYERLTVSMSGAVYRHYQFGPVPDEYRQLLDYAEHEGFLRARIETFVTEDGLKEGTVYDSATAFEPSLFSFDELSILEDVRAHFAQMNATATVSVAHAEAAWLGTPERDVIPYDRGLTLSFVE